MRPFSSPVMLSLLLLGAATTTLAVFAPSGLLSGGGSSEAPEIVFNQARLVSEGEQLYLDAQADIVLPEEVQRGLDSGVPLEFVVELTLAEPRAVWPDKLLATERWRYRLIYYELTRHYRINALDGTGSRNYRSLMRALDGLGSVRAALASLNPAGHIATLQMQLDGSRLPLPLRPVLGNLFGGRIGGSWTVRGEPYRWAFDITELSTQGRV